MYSGSLAPCVGIGGHASETFSANSSAATAARGEDATSPSVADSSEEGGEDGKLAEKSLLRDSEQVVAPEKYWGLRDTTTSNGFLTSLATFITTSNFSASSNVGSEYK